MLILHVLQAEYGECLLVEFGRPDQSRFLLIDGGVATTYSGGLRNRLAAIGQVGGRLDLVILSHVDNDHITGLLDLFAELHAQRASGQPELVSVEALWHNSFHTTIGVRSDLESRLRRLLSQPGSAGAAMVCTQATLAGIGEGQALSRTARQLVIPINPGFPKGRVVLEESPAAVTLGNMSLRVVGPSRSSLIRLRRQWRAWLRRHEEAIGSGDPLLAANSDRSVPNLSSIMTLVEADGRRMLLSGDGRSDHLLQGLERIGLLVPGGTITVDLLKLPHHGSARNVTKTLFDRVRANRYVISTNGRDGNPDPATLAWLAMAIRDQGRSAEILATNSTPSLAAMTANYPQSAYGYRLKILDPGSTAFTLSLSST
jgi:hypothetical protein